MNLSFLTEYVKNKKNPDFTEFVNNSLENIVAVSYGFIGKSPDLLYAWWRRQFALELNRQNKDTHLLQKKIAYNEEKWAEVKNAITALAQTRLRYQTEGLKALADSASSSRRILTLTNALADESSDGSINVATSSSSNDDTVNPLADDIGQSIENTLDDNDGSLFPGAEHKDFQLHRLTYKKIIDGQLLTEKEIFFLQNLNYDGNSIKGALQQFVASKLLSDQLSSTEEEAIKLHMSGIVNLIHSDISKVILSSLPDNLKTKIDYYIPKISQLDPDTLENIERILDFHSNIDGILEYIMVTKAALIRDHKRNTQQYTNVTIIEQMVNNLCLWSEKRDESEATFYRRFASILDTLLADTGVILADGETTLQSSKVAIAMNKAIFHTSDTSQTYGRKIDMILKCSSNVKVDISTNEWKKAMISKSIKLHQQSKNLRLNTSNLFSLNTKFGLKFTIAMDFVGNSGYLYLLRLVNDGPGLDDYITVAHLVTDLFIPTTIESFVTVKDTLRGLITLKDHLVSISWKIRSELQKIEHASSLEDVCPTPSTDSSHPKSPFIFFTPRNNRVQKRKLFELNEYDQSTMNSFTDRLQSLE